MSNKLHVAHISRKLAVSTSFMLVKVAMNTKHKNSAAMALKKLKFDVVPRRHTYVQHKRIQFTSDWCNLASDTLRCNKFFIKDFRRFVIGGHHC